MHYQPDDLRRFIEQQLTPAQFDFLRRLAIYRGWTFDQLTVHALQTQVHWNFPHVPRRLPVAKDDPTR